MAVGSDPRFDPEKIALNQLEQAAPDEDPWKHRARFMRCCTCMWFVPKREEVAGAQTKLGRCRRHAPCMSGYPAVYADDWCGDHKVDENKV